MRKSFWTASLMAFAVTSAAGAAEVVHPGQQKGLGLTGPNVPQILKDARSNPYALPENPDCPGLLQQISTLDTVLGPDLDAPQMKGGGGPDLMAGVRAILPYGGVVRLMTGAARREKELVNDSLAAWERRGFLKGTARMMGCPVFGQPAGAAPQAQPQPSPAPAEPAPR